MTLNSLDARSSLYDPYLPNGPVYASPPVETAIPFPSPPAPVVTNTYSSPFDTPALATHDQPMDFGPPLAERERREASDSTNSRESMNRRSSGSGALSRRSAQRDSFNGKRSSGLHLVGAPSSPTESWRESPFVNENEEAPSGSGGFVRRGRKIYVVHSDAQDGDVHIQLPEGGGRVIELPPTYRDDPHLSASSLPLPHQRTGSAGSGGVNRRPSEMERMELPYLGLEPTRTISRDSGLSGGSGFGAGQSERGMTPDEIRARAEAAMKEKARWSSG